MQVKIFIVRMEKNMILVNMSYGLSISVTALCLQKMVQSTKNIQWAAALWLETPCWLERSENSQPSSSWQEDYSYINNHPLPPRWAEKHWQCWTFRLDGLQQQKNICLVWLLSAKKPNVRLPWRAEKCCLVFCKATQAITRTCPRHSLILNVIINGYINKKKL